MADNQVFEPEFEEIFEAFSQRTAQVRSVNYLKLMTQEGLFWLHGTVNAVDTDREFWHLSCSMCARRVWREEDGLMPCVHCGYVNHYDNYRYNLEVEFVDESGSAWLVLSHEASTRLIGRSVEDVIGFQGAAVTRLPDWIVEDLEGREAVFEVVKTHEEDVHVFDCTRLSIDELILEACEDNYYPHGVQEEDWDNQSVVTERGESDQEVIWRDLPVYVGEPSGVNDPDATQASKRRRTE
ncbi:Replication factor A protein 1 [Castilleja foliolosa]|uniref:Replication factor A protein 1 n=1 Tax=Castilleja foliolosa TaxID=1961234 RepID=A0ABD3BPB2_9LAMI